MKSEWKALRGRLIAPGIVTLLPIAVGLALWNQLPDRLATHFGPGGAADGWSGKPMAVFGLPLLLLAIQWAVAALTHLDPKRRNISGKMLGVVIWVIPAASLLCCGMTYLYTLRGGLDVSRIVTLFLGTLLVVLGNYLPKCRQSYTVGIRLPWTLADEGNWYHTHRFAGAVWVLGGAAVLVTALLPAVPVWAVPAVIAVLALAPVGYSLAYYLRRGQGK
jgi:uncharacterized membrane protein